MSATDPKQTLDRIIHAIPAFGEQLHSMWRHGQQQAVPAAKLKALGPELTEQPSKKLLFVLSRPRPVIWHAPPFGQTNIAPPVQLLTPALAETPQLLLEPPTKFSEGFPSSSSAQAQRLRNAPPTPKLCRRDSRTGKVSPGWCTRSRRACPARHNPPWSSRRPASKPRWRSMQRTGSRSATLPWW